MHTFIRKQTCNLDTLINKIIIGPIIGPTIIKLVHRCLELTWHKNHCERTSCSGLVVLQVVLIYGRGSSAFIPDWLEFYKPLSNENYNGNPHYNRNLYFLHTLLSCLSSLSRKCTSLKVIAVTALDVCSTQTL